MHFTILTDPNFLHAGDHVHLGYGITSPRLTNPAIELAELPPIDLVLLSHFHGDHFDQVVEARLDKDLPIVTTAHAASALSRRGFRAPHALDTWGSLRATRGRFTLRITSTPARHGPPVVASFLPPTMGSLIEISAAGLGVLLRIYISGDTLMHRALREIPKRYPDIDLGLFHLGGTRIGGVLLTMDAEQGVRAVRLIRPRVAIPIHYDDYTVFRSPLADFREAAARASLPSRLVYLARGETYSIDVPSSRLGALDTGMLAAP